MLVQNNDFPFKIKSVFNVFFFQLQGKDINMTLSKTVCESVIYIRSTKIIKIQFSNTGLSMCEKVCNKQDKIILRVESTRVTLVDNYCTKSRLKAASCICGYKVMCKEFIHYAFIHIIPNDHGLVAVWYFEAGHPLYPSLQNLYFFFFINFVK